MHLTVGAMPIADLPPELLALELRRRAQAMRMLGHSLARTPVITLALRAGPEVWAGPAAQHCLDDLSRAARNLQLAADELRLAALRSESRAAHLEHLAALHVR